MQPVALLTGPSDGGDITTVRAASSSTTPDRSTTRPGPDHSTSTVEAPSNIPAIVPEHSSSREAQLLDITDNVAAVSLQGGAELLGRRFEEGDDVGQRRRGQLMAATGRDRHDGAQHLALELGEATGELGGGERGERVRLAVPGLALAEQARGHGRNGTPALLLAVAALAGVEWPAGAENR